MQGCTKSVKLYMYVCRHIYVYLYMYVYLCINNITNYI